MTTFTKFTASVAGLASACTLSLATPAFAGPHGSLAGPGFGGPSVHHPAPTPRPVPPPHHRHRSWHNNDYAWLLAPIAAGALVYGVTQSVRPPDLHRGAAHLRTPCCAFGFKFRHYDDNDHHNENDLRTKDRLLVRSQTRLMAYGARLPHRVESHAGTVRTIPNFEL